MAARALEPDEIRALLEQLDGIRRQLVGGAMTARPATTARLEGACLALRVALGEMPAVDLVPDALESRG